MLTQKIKQQRKERGYSQNYMAEKLGITPSAYSKIERGETKIDTDRLKKLSEVFDMDMNELLSGGGTVIANNNDCSVNGYNDIEAYHSHEAQEKVWERMFQHMKEEIADLRQEKNQLLKMIEKLTENK